MYQQTVLRPTSDRVPRTAAGPDHPSLTATSPRRARTRGPAALAPALLLLATTLACEDLHPDMAEAAAALDIAPPELLCSGVPEALALGVAPPAPPAPVSVPAQACLAHSTATLQQHVNDPTCADIILRPGTYEPAGLDAPYLALRRRTRLWAHNPGDVILRFGISLGANLDHPADFAGSELHGLVIDIHDPAHGVPYPPESQRAAIMFWGKATGVRIHDTIIRGHGALHRGIFAAQPNGLDVRRVEIDGFRRFGLLIPWASPVTDASVQDIHVRRVGDPAWQESPTYLPGTQEHGIWIGFPTGVQRARVRDVHWAGLITAAYSAGNPAMRVERVNLRDIDIDRIGDDHPQGAGTGIYFERITHDLTLTRFCVGPGTQRGVHAEWNHYDPVQSARRLRVGHGVISSAYAGVYLDYGTLDTRLYHLHIRNASWSGVGMYHNYLVSECVVPPGEQASPTLCNTTDWQDLTFDLPQGTPPCELTYSHFLADPPQCIDP